MLKRIPVLITPPLLYVSSVYQGNGMYFRIWCDGSSDRSLLVELLINFLFQPVLNNWIKRAVVISCLWDDTYKIFLDANQRERERVANEVVAMHLRSRYPIGPRHMYHYRVEMALGVGEGDNGMVGTGGLTKYLIIGKQENVQSGTPSPPHTTSPPIPAAMPKLYILIKCVKCVIS